MLYRISNKIDIKIPIQVKNISEKILSFLQARTKIGGLEISDTALRFAYFKDKALHVAGIRLPPGIIESGEVKNREQLVEALRSLREQISADFHQGKLINVVATLSSTRIYIQAFTLPLIEGENLEEAVRLNIKMISPIELSQAYSGWQPVDRNQSESKLEILTAFANKTFVDRTSGLLKEAGFFPIAMETGALSLVRLLREQGAGFEPDKFYLLASIDNRGLQFLIIRRGQLHFEYFNSWKDIQGDTKQISWQDFEAAVKRNLHQVLNFYGSQWPEPLTGAFLLTNSFAEEISKIIKENFSLAVRELKLKLDQPVGRELFEVVGGALRADIPRSKDRDINLLGITVQEEFRRLQIMDFLKFWELLAPSLLGILLAALVISYLSLVNLRNSLESQSSFSMNEKRTEEIGSLKSQIDEFNRLVSFVSSTQGSLKPKTLLADKIGSLMNSGGLTLDRLHLQAGGLPAVLSGGVKSRDILLNFKNALAADPAFDSVNLPLSDIQPKNEGLSFIVNFALKK
ncbi:MAG: hypothetical protein HY433_01950 [Candidatus Liptonbacteria bacterium]|nr:hypothetical protein [Candidatus Liptonbacteria bacterium]